MSRSSSRRVQEAAIKFLLQPGDDELIANHGALRANRHVPITSKPRTLIGACLSPDGTHGRVETFTSSNPRRVAQSPDSMHEGTCDDDWMSMKMMGMHGDDDGGMR